MNVELVAEAREPDVAFRVKLLPIAVCTILLKVAIPETGLAVFGVLFIVPLDVTLP